MFKQVATVVSSAYRRMLLCAAVDYELLFGGITLGAGRSGSAV
jgi:hypothetical protein